MSEQKHKLCYPSLGNYDIAIKFYVEKGAGCIYIPPPAMTKYTVELGAKHSPDFVCAPFKSHMGNYIEALEEGANVLIQTGGTCRLGYYAELQEQILKDMGYEFEMLNLNPYRYRKLIPMLRDMIKLVDDGNLVSLVRALPGALRMVVFIDRVEDYYRQNMGFEVTRGDFDKVYKRFLNELREANSLGDARRAYKKAMEAMEAVPTDKPEHPLRVGFVGEYFTIMDPFSNHEIERKLAMMGTEVHRWMNLSHSVLICPDERTLKKLAHYIHYDIHKFPSSIWVNYHKELASKYVRFNTGSSSVATVALAEHYAKQGYDGIVHIKSFGCTPEMDCIPILHNISEDYHIPMLFMSYDTQTSDTGIDTRLEAFYDMMAQKAQKS